MKIRKYNTYTGAFIAFGVLSFMAKDPSAIGTLCVASLAFFALAIADYLSE